MTIDLEQFHQVFFEESIEGLDIMESSLMELDPEDIDSETINAIFRCAHSIKGGSATFGFSSIAEFTHVLETLLDQVRSGERGLSTNDVDLYLKSVDCMREMLSLLQDGEGGETEASAALQAQFVAILEGSVVDGERIVAEESTDDSAASLIGEAIVPEVSSPKSNELESESKSTGKFKWRIHFRPYESVFLTGNDPLRNLQALSDLGEIKVVCDDESVPSLIGFNVEHSYLAWQIQLESECTEADISEIFEWIEDECDLEIERIEAPSSQKQKKAAIATENISDAPSLSWLVQFTPGVDVLKSGNEPGKLFEVLRDYGDLAVEANTTNIPDLVSMDAENCYLSWTLRLLNSSASEDDILSVFEWVADESDIQISTLGEQKLVAPDKSEKPSASSAPIAAPAASGSPKTAEKATRAPAPKVAKPKSAGGRKVAAKSAGSDTSSIRVGIDKVDSLINMVGELVITQSMLGQLSDQVELERVPNLVEGLNQLEQNTRELQESVMKIRMLPISFAFSRFPRMVRDLGKSLGKSVEIEMHGENTELDKTVMEKIGDPLVHLVRNSVDHGLELPEERTALGKDPTGKVTLNAFHQSGNVVIEIIDDGKGLDREKIISKAVENNLVTEAESSSLSDEQIYDLIFQPGFSTAQAVSDVSGRGVGMDVVKRNIQALNGVVEISSKINKGSKITIKLPLTLAILDGQLVKVGSQTFIFPLTSIIESLQCKAEFVNQVAGGCSVFKLREEYVPIIELYKAFSVEPDSRKIEDSLLVVVESEGEKVGIVVDDLLAQQQVVIKSLEQNYRKVEGVSGATILGDGTVALILDIPGIIKLSEEQVGLNTSSLGNIISDFDVKRHESTVSLHAAAN